MPQLFDEEGSLLDPINGESSSYGFEYMILAIGFLLLTYALLKKFQNSNRVQLEDNSARTIGGCLQWFSRIWHTNNDRHTDLPTEGPAILALGDHLTGADGVYLASTLPGTKDEPAQVPEFFATTSHNNIPGVAGFLKMFKTIPVHFNKPKKGIKGPRSDAIERGVEAIERGGMVAIFPQGNICYMDKDAPLIYPGAARMAIKTKTPIHVIRLDGFWSVYNPYLPKFIRNSQAWRLFFSFLHMNNVKPTLCCVIDCHLKPENQDKSQPELERLINAEMYAYFRNLGDLTPEQIDKIREEVAQGRHLKMWDLKYKRYLLEKEVRSVTEEYAELQEQRAGYLQLTSP